MVMLGQFPIVFVRASGEAILGTQRYLDDAKAILGTQQYLDDAKAILGTHRYLDMKTNIETKHQEKNGKKTSDGGQEKAHD